MSDFGATIQDFCRLSRWSFTYLADYLGVNPSTVWRWVNVGTEPQPKRKAQFLRELNFNRPRHTTSLADALDLDALKNRYAATKFKDSMDADLCIKTAGVVIAHKLSLNHIRNRMEINNDNQVVIHFSSPQLHNIAWHVLGSNAGIILQWRDNVGTDERITNLQVLTNEFLDHLVKTLNKKLINHELNN